MGTVDLVRKEKVQSCLQQSEKFQLTTPYEDQERLAQRLELPDSFRTDIYSYVAGHKRMNVEEFRARMGRWILIAFETAEGQKLEEVRTRLNVRIFFETLMAWHTLRQSDNSRDKLLAVLKDNWERMNDLLARPFNQALADEIWDLDGQFHRAICEASHLDHFVDLIDAVISDCRKIASARTLNRAKHTLLEHREIIEALYAGDAQRVFDAIYDHVIKSALRCFEGKESLEMQAPEEDKSLSQYDWVVQAATQPRKYPPTLGQRSQAAFKEGLPKLLEEHEGKWVAFLGERQVALENSRRALMKECSRFCSRENVRPSDLACHRIVVRDL